MMKTFSQFISEDYTPISHTTNLVRKAMSEKGHDGGYEPLSNESSLYVIGRKGKAIARNGPLYNHLKKNYGFEKWTSGHGIINKETGHVVYTGPNGNISIFDRKKQKDSIRAAPQKTKDHIESVNAHLHSLGFSKGYDGRFYHPDSKLVVHLSKG